MSASIWYPNQFGCSTADRARRADQLADLFPRWSSIKRGCACWDRRRCPRRSPCRCRACPSCRARRQRRETRLEFRSRGRRTPGDRRSPSRRRCRSICGSTSAVGKVPGGPGSGPRSAVGPVRTMGRMSRRKSNIALPSSGRSRAGRGVTAQAQITSVAVTPESNQVVRWTRDSSGDLEPLGRVDPGRLGASGVRSQVALGVVDRHDPRGRDVLEGPQRGAISMPPVDQDELCGARPPLVERRQVGVRVRDRGLDQRDVAETRRSQIAIDRAQPLAVVLDAGDLGDPPGEPRGAPPRAELDDPVARAQPPLEEPDHRGRQPRRVGIQALPDRQPGSVPTRSGASSAVFRSRPFAEKPLAGDRSNRGRQAEADREQPDPRRTASAG